MEYGRFAKEIADQVGINPNTLRRWSLELEKLNYKFERNERSQRIYYKTDLSVLHEMKKFLDKNFNLEEAATKSIEVTKENEVETVTVSTETNVLTTIRERSGEIEIFQEKFVQMVDQQNKIVEQNQQILDLLLEEKKEKEDAQKEVKILQERLDKAISLLQEDQEQANKKKKRFLGIF
ncbi:MerR family transcriptional regulator [Bacillus cereus group sp. BfR-BA-01326]|uniref:MerR family transcriptional regulator n=1 Tax=Bacillus cereus group sp. BfR-BA-01326 TaxID=2920302 RepID=UPI001F5AA4F1|nr:MerR family transcriptional regulator [Bacillus cereus group sp. BfR-BA-01326]